MPPSSDNYKRDYAQEAKTAKRRGEHKDNASRKRAMRSKPKCSGDIHHKDGNPRNNSPSNLECIPASKNRSFSRKGNAKKYDTSKVRKNSTQRAGAYRVK